MSWRRETHFELEQLESYVGDREFPIDLLTYSLIEFAKFIIGSEEAKRELGLKLSVLKAASILLHDPENSENQMSQETKMTFGWAIHDSLEHNPKGQSFLRIVIMSLASQDPALINGVDSQEMESVFDSLNSMGSGYPKMLREFFIGKFQEKFDA